MNKKVLLPILALLVVLAVIVALLTFGVIRLDNGNSQAKPEPTSEPLIEMPPDAAATIKLSSDTDNYNFEVTLSKSLESLCSKTTCVAVLESVIAGEVISISGSETNIEAGKSTTLTNLKSTFSGAEGAQVRVSVLNKDAQITGSVNSNLVKF